MCVSVYVCMYAHTYTQALVCILAYTHTHAIYVYVDIHVSARDHTHMYADA